ncbi:MAG: endonuclease/exonuclease/phosphatase family protein [Candidatus Neomarinimicrobiota bacterium]
MRVCILSLLLLFLGCGPLATSWDEAEEAISYTAIEIAPPPTAVDTILVMTWNIRYGAGRIPWFGDGCGDRVLLTEREVIGNLKVVADKINDTKPDILILQEVDVESKRTAFVDQVQWLLDHTHLNYGAYASYWQVQFIPSDGLGRMDAGNAILSRWNFTETERVPLPLRGDQSSLTQYFYLRRNILKVKLDLPSYEDFYAVGVHTAAFSTDDTKQNHINTLKEELDALDNTGALFVAGGDLNELPPESDSTDYCDEDKCDGESFHSSDDDHKEGAYYGLETTWLNGLYRGYRPAIRLNEYFGDNVSYFTYFIHDFTESSPPHASGGRKLDYLFTNLSWATDSDSTHQGATRLSDHIPISAKLVLSP